MDKPVLVGVYFRVFQMHTYIIVGWDTLRQFTKMPTHLLSLDE